MLLVSENLLLKYLEADEKFKLAEFVNKKLFTVSDTPLTYRQINSLDGDNLLTTDRNKKKGWRKFSFKELVYVLIVHELKKFGLKHEHLKQLWKLFFETNVAETAIGGVFGLVEIIMTIDSEGQVIFYDPIHYLLFSNDRKSVIQIKLNDIVNSILEKTGKSELIPKWSITQEIYDKNDINLSGKEEELIKILRDKSYTAIRVKKKDGDEILVYAERVKNGVSEYTPQDLLKVINSKDYQDINIAKRDGKIVNFRVEETIKL